MSCRLQALTSRTLQGLSQLQSIDLSNNKIAMLDPQIVLPHQKCPQVSLYHCLSQIIAGMHFLKRSKRLSLPIRTPA